MYAIQVLKQSMAWSDSDLKMAKNSSAYKDYYAIASGAAPPKTKVSVRKTKSSSDTTITPPTTAGTRLSTSAKGKQPAKSSKAKDEGTGIIPWVPDVPTDESDEEISWKSSDEDDDDEIDERSDDQEDDDDQDTDNDSDDFVHPKLSIHEEEAKDEEIFDLIVQKPKNSDDEGNDDASLGMNVGSEEGHDAEDDDEELYRDININLEGRDVQMTNVHTTQEFEDTHVTLTLVNLDGQQQSLSVSSQFVTSMLNLSPDACIDSLFESTPWMDVQALTTVVPLILTALTLPPPTIPTISPPTTAASTFLQDLLNFGSLFGFDHHLKTLKANFAEFVQINQFARAVSSIPIIVERYMDEQMNEAILNLYKALVDAYECDKIILDTYGDTVTLKRHRDDADKDEEPSVGSDRWSKRRREGKEPESTSAPKEQATKTTGKSTQGSKSYQKMQQKKLLTSDRAWNKNLPATHRSIQPWISDLATQDESRSSFNELMDTPVDFAAFLMNQLKVHTLTPKLLAGLTYKLMKGSCKSLLELEFFLEKVYKATIDQFDWNNPIGQQYLHNLLKPLPLMLNSQGRRVIPFDHFINNNLEYLRGGASIRKYTTFVTKTKAADYRHINSIDLQSTGSLLEMSTQNVESSLSSNFRLSNSIVTSIWIGSRCLEMMTSYTSSKKATSRGFTFNTLKIDDKSHGRRTLCFQRLFKNVHKKHCHPTTYGRSLASDGTLNDVRTALDDRLKGIRMKYLPQAIWRRSDKERAATML
nr:hypothetical protein [Tanacetum cinerariifolium]